MAHKLARILWRHFKYRPAFAPARFQPEEEKMKRQQPACRQNTATAPGLKLVPA
jgi:hypothetical protein